MSFRINPFIMSLVIIQILIIIGYSELTFHDGYGDQQKLDEARQQQKDKEDALREPTPAPEEYEYGQPDLSYMFDMNMYTYLGMCLTMTYLRKYAYTSLGMSFLMGCLAQEWCCLLLQWIPLAHCSYLKSTFVNVGCPYGNNPDLTQFENLQRELSCTCDSLDEKIGLTIADFIRGQYGVVAVLVSYGALLGKVNPLQMLIIVVMNVAAYVGNKFLCVDYRGGVDNTGSLYTTHIFGASFGLGCSMVVSGRRPSENPDNAPRYQSNNYAILGSLFMFVTYPSFNCFWAPAALRVYVATNTFVSLIAGGMFSFIWANFLYPEGPSVMHLQDGVLAAGVAASTPACMFIPPVFMMLVGAGGTLIATVSFRYIQHQIDDQDTQGITSLHLLPGLWGALVMEVVTIIGIDNNWVELDNAHMMDVIMPHFGQVWYSDHTGPHHWLQSADGAGRGGRHWRDCQVHRQDRPRRQLLGPRVLDCSGRLHAHRRGGSRCQGHVMTSSSTEFKLEPRPPGPRLPGRQCHNNKRPSSELNLKSQLELEQHWQRQRRGTSATVAQRAARAARSEEALRRVHAVTRDALAERKRSLKSARQATAAALLAPHLRWSVGSRSCTWARSVQCADTFCATTAASTPASSWTSGFRRFVPGWKPAFSHRTRKFCCCPMTEPGRTMRSHPMASRAEKPWCFIIQSAMSVPVRPSPALQCTPTSPGSSSQMSRNDSTISALGFEQSAKKRSWWMIPRSTKCSAKYVPGSFSRTTAATPLARSVLA